MPNLAVENQLILQDYLGVWIQNFLVSKKSENLAKGSLEFYKFNLNNFIDYCDSMSIKSVSQLTPTILREFLLSLENSRSAGGIHGIYRSIRAFLNWYWDEVEPDSKNPIKKVKPPKVVIEPIHGITKQEFEKLLAVCPKNCFLGERDKAVLMTLMDTGIRAMELCRIKLEDVNLLEHSVLIKQGKGRKPRTVFFGRTTRRQIRKYLKYRKESDYLFTNQSSDPMCYETLRQILVRLGRVTGIKGISPHDFRRGFCLGSLQAGTDLLTLSRLMGHTGLSLLSRYANQSNSDLHEKFKSIVD